MISEHIFQITLESMAKIIENQAFQNQELMHENIILKERIKVLENGKSDESFSERNSANRNKSDEEKTKNIEKIKENRYKVFERSFSLFSMLITVVCFMLQSLFQENNIWIFVILLTLIIVVIFVIIRRDLRKYPLPSHN